MEDLDTLSDDRELINITPLVDVSLVLVLIFLVTSPVIVKQIMDVKLPEAVSSKSEVEENLTVSIGINSVYQINEIAVTKAGLFTELKKQKTKSGINYLLIRADEQIAYEDVEDVMKIAKRLRFSRVAFATTPKVLQ